MQAFLVAVIVAVCSLYAAWKLMPAALRRRVAAALSGLPLPATLAGWLARHAGTASGCGGGCDGCGTTAAAPAASTQPIVFHPRREANERR